MRYDRADTPARGARVQHEKVCPGKLGDHPDLIELEANLEYWFGDMK